MCPTRVEHMFYRSFMGSRRTVYDKAKPREPTKHAWVWPRGQLGPAQGLVVETTQHDGEQWVRVIYVVPHSKPPTVMDTWMPGRLCTPVNSQPVEPNY